MMLAVGREERPELVAGVQGGDELANPAPVGAAGAGSERLALKPRS
jgi:hypothetical protein